MYSKRLFCLRTGSNVVQKEVAKLLDISRSLYGRYESEYEIMPINHLNIVCNYFNVSVDYIFNFTDKQQYANCTLDIDLTKAGRRLKEFRKEQKITQEKLAQELNTVQPVIANYEKGKHLISTPFLYTICKKYGVSADYLLGKIDEVIYFSSSI